MHVDGCISVTAVVRSRARNFVSPVSPTPVLSLKDHTKSIPHSKESNHYVHI